MQFSEAWLKELISIPVDTNTLSHQLTMAGLEVDAVHPVAAEFNNVCVGYVESKEQHPDADKLSVCMVDVGDAKTQIVCGAKNIEAGQKVPVAKVGAVLPGDFKIKAAKLRGVDSNGMICSESEIGLAEKSEGIMVLPEDAPVGTDIREYLKLNDQMIEIDLTANRGDCLSLHGVAREVAVANAGSFKPSDVEAVKQSHDEKIDVKLSASEQCPLYLSRVIKGIKPGAKSPLWLAEKLRRSGLRAIHPVVDVTNYIMLLMGQPMHAFDAAKLNGDVRIELSTGGDKIKLLDESEVEVKPGTLLIKDDKGPIALAGIMGGLESSVTDETTDIVLEAAHFTPDAIRGKARSYGLHTDSSHRFERGVDPSLPKLAMEAATQLILSVVGGEAGPVNQMGEVVVTEKQVSLRPDRVNAVLGTEISEDEVIRILEGLGFESSELNFKIPSYRFDINIEEDLIEEVARIHGLDNIKSSLPKSGLVQVGLTEKLNHAKDVLQLLAARGYTQAINYSFIDQKWQKTFFPDVNSPVLQNPISSDMAQMRGSLLPGLLLSAKRNLNRQVDRVHLCEQGIVFTDALEIEKLAFVKCGLRDQEHFSGTEKADFYDLKGDLQALFVLCGKEVVFAPTDSISYLHPGKAAQISCEGDIIGVIGQLHPVAQKAVGLKQAVFVAEIDWDSILPADIAVFEAISKYPSIRRDFAFVVDKDLPAQNLINACKKSLGDLLQKANVFDVYTGEELGSRKKSLALSLILQDLSHTLIEEEVNSAVNTLLEVLLRDFNAKLRE